jgi:hypothetical protein
VTEAELLEELLRHSKTLPDNGKEPGTITTPEIRAALRCGDTIARKTANALVAEGRIVRDRVKRDAGWGVVQKVPGYRIVQ